MNAKTMTIPEIRREGFDALLQRLGPAGALRFVQQFDSGRGDYTNDRAAWLDGVTIDEILQRIETKQADQ